MLDGEPLPRHGCTPHHLVETPVPSLRQRRRLTQPLGSQLARFSEVSSFSMFCLGIHQRVLAFRIATQLSP
jgi:hypothetical protein